MPSLSSGFVPAPVLKPLLRPLPERRSFANFCQAKPAAGASTNTETCSPSKVVKQSEFWDLFSRGLVNSTPPSHPVILEFTRTLPSYLVDYAYYRMTHYVFSTEHRDGEMWHVRHLFDAVANVSSFEILSPKKARFRAHLVNDKYIEGIKSRTFSDLHMVYVGKQPGRTWYDMVRNFFGIILKPTLFPSSRNRLTNFCIAVENIPTKGLCARSDVNLAAQLDHDTQKSGEIFSFEHFNPALRGQFSTSHGIWKDGVYFNYVAEQYMFLDFAVKYNIFSIDQSGNCDILLSFHAPFSHPHSFVVTDQYVVIGIGPLRIDVSNLLAHSSVLSSYRFTESRTKLLVISRKERRIVKEYSCPSSMDLHIMNAYENGDDVVMDVCHHDNHQIYNETTIENFQSGRGVTLGRAKRMVLKDISKKEKRIPKVHSTLLCATRFELPSVNPNYYGRPCRYVYCNTDSDKRQFLGDVAKLDLETGEVKRWSKGGIFTSEPVFIPDPDGKYEDSGSLLVMILNAKKNESALLVLNARTMREISRAKLGFGQGHGFHAFATKMGKEATSQQ